MSDGTSNALLENRDYTVIIAKTIGSMGVAPPYFEKRWTDACTAIVALAEICAQFDPDGITIYISSKSNQSGSFQQYQHVLPSQVSKIFTDNIPPEHLNLVEALKLALDSYFARKELKQTKSNGTMIIVLIDREPLDRLSMVKVIVQAAQQIERDEELGIGFLQVGDDLITRGFLNALDQDLRSQAGAKFDIVHTRVLDTIQPDSLTNFLTDIIRE